MTAVESRRLRYFVEVVEQGSLTSAAARLRISQAALSKAMRELEAEFAVRLLDRSARGVSPTPFGDSLYAHAKTVGAAIDQARSAIETLKDRAHAHLTVGVLPDLGCGIIPDAVVRLCRERPSVHVRVIERTTFDLIVGLRRGEFDFIVNQETDIETDAALKRRLLFSDSLSVVAGAAHPLAGRARVSAEDLLAFPWVFATFGGAHRPRIERLFRQMGHPPPPPQIEGATIEFAKMVIRGGRHLTAMPLHALGPDIAAGAVTALPVQSPALARRITAMYLDHRPPSPVGRALIEEIRKVR